MVVGHTMILPNKRVSARESVASIPQKIISKLTRSGLVRFDFKSFLEMVSNQTKPMLCCLILSVS